MQGILTQANAALDRIAALEADDSAEQAAMDAAMLTYYEATEVLMGAPATDLEDLRAMAALAVRHADVTGDEPEPAERLAWSVLRSLAGQFVSKSI